MRFALAILAVYGSAAAVAYALITRGHWIAGTLIFALAIFVKISVK